MNAQAQQTEQATQAWHDPDAPRDEEAIAKTDPNKDNRNNNPRVAQHQALDDPDTRKQSGKDIGLVDAPLVSINPTSGNQKLTGDGKQPKDYKIFDHANQRLNNPAASTYVSEFRYPFDKLEIDQGFFVPVTEGTTTDKLMDQVHDQINIYREQTAECEKDKEGNDVWESVVIQTKKRTDDGVIQLDSFNKPIVGANQTNRPKLIYAANFIARPVVKGDNMLDEGKGEEIADSDGVLVIRVL